MKAASQPAARPTPLAGARVVGVGRDAATGLAKVPYTGSAVAGVERWPIVRPLTGPSQQRCPDLSSLCA